MSLFTEEEQRYLFQGKYLKWAEDIDLDTLRVLFWFVGEFSYGNSIENYITMHSKIVSATKLEIAIRASKREIAQEIILRICKGERFLGKDAVHKVFDEALKKRFDNYGEDDEEVTSKEGDCHINHPKFLIFLDFDGVLHPLHANEHEKFKPEAIESVNRILDELEANIVLSSAWRMDFSIDKFNPWFRNRIIGSTPVHELDLKKENPRFHEVIGFLERHKWLHVPWIAIDDKRAHFPLDSPAYITDQNAGITKIDADNIIMIGRSMEFALSSLEKHAKQMSNVVNIRP